MSDPKPGKSPNDQNRWQLWLVIVANCVALYLLAQGDRLGDLGPKALLSGAANLLPVGLALTVTTLANGLLSADMKARLVFLRWHHALPGHRAFSRHMHADPRIDVERLRKALGNKVPGDPVEQNRTWYRMFKEVEREPPALHAHREFLLARDCTGFALLFLIAFGTAAAFAAPSWRGWGIYCLVLVVQLAVTRQAAATYGVRLVRTVLALKAAKAARAPRSAKPAG